LHSNACEEESVDKVVIIPFIDLAWTDIDDKSRAIAEKFGEESTSVKLFNGLAEDLLGTEKENELFVIFYEIMAE
jgi:hypothetical protein